MSIPNMTKTVRELALEMPNATRIFEKLKIDYCCGGSRPLDEACAAAGVEVGAVMSELEKSATTNEENGSARDFQTIPLTDVMSYIVETHHVFTRAEIDRLRALLDKVCSVHGENHPELLKVRAVFRVLCQDLAPHMFKEEQILFPYIQGMEAARKDGRDFPAAPFVTVRNPVRMMMMEHDTAGDLLKELRQITSDYTAPPDVCISYQTLYQAMEAFEKDLHQHIHLENNILFPRAIEMEDASI